MRDPKFGYHWIWLYPLIGIYILWDRASYRTIALYKWARIRYIEWRYPEIKKLKKLAGK